MYFYTRNWDDFPLSDRWDFLFENVPQLGNNVAFMMRLIISFKMSVRVKSGIHRFPIKIKIMNGGHPSQTSTSWIFENKIEEPSSQSHWH